MQQSLWQNCIRKKIFCKQNEPVKGIVGYPIHKTMLGTVVFERYALSWKF